MQTTAASERKHICCNKPKETQIGRPLRPNINCLLLVVAALFRSPSSILCDVKAAIRPHLSNTHDFSLIANANAFCLPSLRDCLALRSTCLHAWWWWHLLSSASAAAGYFHLGTKNLRHCNHRMSLEAVEEHCHLVAIDW